MVGAECITHVGYIRAAKLKKIRFAMKKAWLSGPLASKAALGFAALSFGRWISIERAQCEC